MASPDVTIVDYGVGNVESLRNALARVGRSAEVTGDPDRIAIADRLILPGVGSFDRAARMLRDRGLASPVRDAVTHRGIPVAGICLGMQLLMEGSDEGVEPGLGIIAGRSARFPDEVNGRRLLVPHMGWSQVTAAKPSRLAPALVDGNRYYFVHSFAVQPQDHSDVLAWTDYGIRYVSAIERDNVLGIQFHPEKSHRYGLALLRDFAGGA